MPRKVGLLNQDAGIECKYFGSLVIIGISGEREGWDERMMRVGYFGDANLGVYMGARKKFDPTYLPCLLQV